MAGPIGRPAPDPAGARFRCTGVHNRSRCAHPGSPPPHLSVPALRVTTVHTGIELIGIVGQNAFHKGRAYAREGRAAVLSHDTFEESVSGTCRASGMRTYQVAGQYPRTTNGIF